MALAAMTAALFAREPPKPQPGMSLQQVRSPEEYDVLEPGRGRLATSPHKIPLKGWKDILWRTYQEVTHDRLSAVAGSVTFYTLMAIFPALGVFASLYGLFSDVEQARAQLADLATVFPRSVLDLVGDQMMRVAGKRPFSLSAAFVLFLLVSVWSANGGVKALVDGLNIAYDETEKRNYFVRQGLTYAFTFGALMFLILVTVILVAAPIAIRNLGYLRMLEAWIPMRWFVLGLVAASAFSILFRYGPCRSRARWRWVSGGGVVAAILWMVGSLGFSWYLNNVAHLDATYGSLGAVIAFMLWVHVSVMAVLIGAEFSAEIEHQTAVDSTTGAPLPIGQRGAAMADTVGLALRGGLWAALMRAWGMGQRQAGRVHGYIRRKRGKPTKADQASSSSKAASRAA
ncbi:MAG: YihY/virulence factor BrkB family protein [Phenylobacterium sp.]